MNPLKTLSSPNNSIESESDDKLDEYTDKKEKQRPKKLKSTTDLAMEPLLKNGISAREQKKIDQYARLFQQQDKVHLTTHLKAEKKKQKKIKIKQRLMDSKDQQQPKDQLEESVNKSSEEKPCEKPSEKAPIEIDAQLTVTLEPINQEFQTTNLVSPQYIQMKQENKAQVDEENDITFKLLMNPKSKIQASANGQEKNNLFLYLSECQDRCSSTMQKLASTAPQLYSPSRSYMKNEQSNLSAINSEVYHETQILTSNLTSRFKSYGEPVTNFGPEQREFISKYVDKKHLRNVLRESRMQIYKRGAEKPPQSIKGFSKLIPKKY